MVGMGVVETDDVLTALTPSTLNADQFLGIDVVAVVGGIGAGIAGAGDGSNRADAIFIQLPEQHAAAFVGIGLLAVLPESFVLLAPDIQHGELSSPQRHRAKLLSPS